MTCLALVLAALFVGACVGYWYAKRKEPPPTVYMNLPTIHVDYAIIDDVLKQNGMVAIRKEMLSSLAPTRH